MEKKRTRIKIKDLPKTQRISKEHMKKVVGGISLQMAISAMNTYPVDCNSKNVLPYSPIQSLLKE